MDYDVIVAGAGNAALTAALSAREAGARVLVLEKAPQEARGGNTFFTDAVLRFPHGDVAELSELVPDLSTESIEVVPYSPDQFYADIMRITEGLSDPELAQVLVTQANSTFHWMTRQGVRWLPAFSFAPRTKSGRSRLHAIPLEASGGGKGLSDALFSAAERQGVEVRYESKVVGLLTNGQGRVRGVRVMAPGVAQEVEGATVVLACGGFEANREMRARYLGPDWDLVKVRGTRYNTGEGLRAALEVGAQPAGHWSGCHAIHWDLAAPPYGDRRLTILLSRRAYHLGIVVNIAGQRFLDEGEDFVPFTYARYGRLILGQPQRVAFQIFDSRVRQRLPQEYSFGSSATADSVEGLADALGVDREGLARTVQEYNAAVQEGNFNPAALDGVGTRGLTPPKSNWALSLDTPPYYGYSVVCGITFTFGGVAINTRAQVLDTEDRPIPGLYAAGEMVGGLFFHNYPGGSGLTAGAVFGRIAGASAAEDARALRASG
ncbi:MAG: FAD-dependent tricarballylate dehydrogenase TcuA [Chloroflexi bacterium]|nr:FAD-dependent tricarballylate dehydrogenase TcuA [Chloroflexota bacterium]